MSYLSLLDALPVVDCSMHEVLRWQSCDLQISCACAAQVEVRPKRIDNRFSTWQMPQADSTPRCTAMSDVELPCKLEDRVCKQFSVEYANSVAYIWWLEWRDHTSCHRWWSLLPCSTLAEVCFGFDCVLPVRRALQKSTIDTTKLFTRVFGCF